MQHRKHEYAAIKQQQKMQHNFVLTNMVPLQNIRLGTYHNKSTTALKLRVSYR